MKKLIYRNTNAIKNTKDFVNSVIPGFQKIYDAFKGLGIVISLDQLIYLMQTLRVRDGGATLKSRISEIVSDQLLEKAGEPNFNGVPINKEKLKEMISLPDISSLVEAVTGLEHLAYQTTNFTADLLQINKDLIVKADGFEKLVEDKNSQYTKTKKGADLMDKLDAVKTAIEEYYCHLRGLNIASDYENIASVKGLKTEDRYNNFVIDVSFVSSHDN